MENDNDPVIVSYARTPLGKYLGGLSSLSAPELGSFAIKKALEKIEMSEEVVDEVLMGNVLQAGVGQHPARQAAMGADIPLHVGATTINKMCGSGMKALMLAANSIRVREHNVVIAGGMESMSNASYLKPRNKEGKVDDSVKFVDSMLRDGLCDPYNGVHMASTGDLIAEKMNITREECDEFAYESHMRAKKAYDEDLFRHTVREIEVEGNIIGSDEGVRGDTSIEKLNKLNALFSKDGVVTAGNASQITDGGAVCIVTSRRFATNNGLKIIAAITGQAVSGCAPMDVMYAPVPTVKLLWEKTGHTEKDYDLYEHNEAFASASLAVAKELGLSREKLNVWGGAIALGHPIGCSGARIVMTLISSLKNAGGKRGFATACLGGGLATAIEIEIE